MLVRRTALEDVGGVNAIRDRLIDDCALAALLKPRGAIWLGLTTSTKSLRVYSRLAEIWNMVTRTAFVQLRHSFWMLAGTVAGMVLLYVIPPAAFIVGLVSDSAGIAGLGALTWLIMGVLYRPTLGLYNLSPWWGLLLPLAGVLYTLMTVESARRHFVGTGGRWKGRHYDGLRSTGG